MNPLLAVVGTLIYLAIVLLPFFMAYMVLFGVPAAAVVVLTKKFLARRSS